MIDRQNVRRKLFGLVLIPTCLLSLLLGYFGFRDYQLLRDGLLERGVSQARHLAEVAEFGLVTGNLSHLTAAANGALVQGATAAWIYDAEGRVAVAVGESYPIRIRTSSAAEACGETNNVLLFCAPARMLPFSIDDFTEFRIRENSARPVGYVAIGLSTSDLTVRRASVTKSYAGVFLTILLLGLWLAKNVERQLARPIARLRDAVEQIEKGELSTRVAEDTGGELLILQRGFNGMAQSLESNHAEQEHRIHEATSRLRQTLQELEVRNGELDSEKQRAEAASVAKSRFLAVMSHEIRTPLSGMVGMLSLLEQSGLKEEQAGFVRHVESAAETLRLLIDEILDYSRIEAGKLAVVTRAMRLMTVIDEVVNMLAPSAANKGLEFVVHVEHDVPDGVTGDALRLRQVLINLTANAIKFTEAGMVRLLVQRIGGTVDRPRLRFSVEDTGIGIPASKQDQVFESFTQVDSGTTRRYNGAGLGTAVSRELVQLMGGEIGLTSTLGVGSQFWFELALEADLSGPAQERPLVGKSVAVIEPHTYARSALVGVLESLGAKVSSIDAGQTTTAGYDGALDYLFLCEGGAGDIMHASATEYRARALFICHVVSMTSRGSSEGFDARLSKPVTRSRLLSTLGGRATPNGGESPTNPTIRPLRILVAEDDEINARVITSLLSKLGHEVTRARDGVAALAQLKLESFDVAILDVRMPEADGPTVAMQWRAQERNIGGYLPMVALTANGSQEDMELCRNSGIDEFLVKPVSGDTLARVLSRLVNRAADLERGADAS